MSELPLSPFERMADRARAEAAPRVDVADGVMRALSRSAPRAVEPELLVAGIGSVLAAGIALAVLWFGPSAESALGLVQPFLTGQP